MSNNKVFVSPGVYTSEVDLSFVSQSVGVTTLGIVGETLQGPAFEPIFITNYDEFTTYFGGTSPEKFVNTQISHSKLFFTTKKHQVFHKAHQVFYSVSFVKPQCTLWLNPSFSVLILNSDST